MIYPTVHMNGTSHEVLLRQALRACEALDAALAAMAEAAPNSRDYYPQGDGAFLQAVGEFNDVVGNVRSARTHFEIIASRLSEGS